MPIDTASSLITEPLDLQALATASDENLDEVLVQCAGTRAWLSAQEGAVVAEIERRGRWASGVLVSTQRIGARAAKQQVKIAKRIFGDAKQASLDQVVAALFSERITPEHARVIALLPRDYDDAVDQSQTELVAKAEELIYDQFVSWLSGWRADVDRAAGMSPGARQKKSRKTSSGVRSEDGMHVVSSEFEPMVGAAIDKQIAIVDQAMWRIDCKLAVSQRRTPAQRRNDAHAWLILRPVRSESMHLPTKDDFEIEAALGRADVTVMVIATLDDLQAGTGELVDGTLVELDDVIRSAARLNIVPAVFDSAGVNLWQGRKHRIPTEPLRQAVIARDRHCTFPDCTVPAQWTQLHHILWWSKGGTTDPHNLCLLCSEHHHFVHDKGWRVERLTDGSLRWQAPAVPTVEPDDPHGNERRADPPPIPSGTEPTPRQGATVHNLIRKQPSRSNGGDADDAATDSPAA